MLFDVEYYNSSTSSSKTPQGDEADHNVDDQTISEDETFEELPMP